MHSMARDSADDTAEIAKKLFGKMTAAGDRDRENEADAAKRGG